METPVLIVIDMLRDFLSSWKPDRTDRLVQSINELVGVMRSFSRPVLWVRQEFEPDLRDALPEMRAKGIRITIKGTPGSEILPELAVAPSDLVLVKKRYSAFFGTTLDETLARSNRMPSFWPGSIPTLAFAPPRSTHTSEIGP